MSRPKIPKFPGLDKDRQYLADLMNSGRKFVVVSRSEGLGDVLFSIGHAWFYCKKTGRTLLVDLANSRYLYDKEMNAATELFQIPVEFDGVNILTPPRVSWNLRKIFYSNSLIQKIFLLYPPFFAYFNLLKRLIAGYLPAATPYLNRSKVLSQDQEKHLISTGKNPRAKFVNFRGCHWEFLNEVTPFLKSIRPGEKINSAIQKITQKFNGRFIGLHVRYYDPELPESRHSEYWKDFNKALEEIQRQIDMAKSYFDPSCRVFLSTDSQLVEDSLLRLRRDVVTYKKDFGDATVLELHYKSVVDLGSAAVIEMFVLNRAAALVRYPPSKSWFSELAARTCPIVIS